MHLSRTRLLKLQRGVLCPLRRRISTGPTGTYWSTTVYWISLSLILCAIFACTWTITTSASYVAFEKWQPLPLDVTESLSFMCLNRVMRFVTCRSSRIHEVTVSRKDSLSSLYLFEIRFSTDRYVNILSFILLLVLRVFLSIQHLSTLHFNISVIKVNNMIYWCIMII